MSFVLDYKDKVVLVTGVSSGIGLGVARVFAHEGARVVLADWDEARAAEEAETIRAEGLAASHVGVDVMDRDQVLAMFANRSLTWKILKRSIIIGPESSRFIKIS